MSQDELQKFINLISRLPGIGQRSAQRIALYLIKNKQELIVQEMKTDEFKKVLAKFPNAKIIDIEELERGDENDG